VRALAMEELAFLRTRLASEASTPAGQPASPPDGQALTDRRKVGCGDLITCEWPGAVYWTPLVFLFLAVHALAVSLPMYVAALRTFGEAAAAGGLGSMEGRLEWAEVTMGYSNALMEVRSSRCYVMHIRVTWCCLSEP
jgi:hypothetical protein